MRTYAFVVLFFAVVSVGCAQISEIGPTLGSGPGLDRPPNLMVTAGDNQLTLRPYAYCWTAGGQGICADGAAPDPLPSLALADDDELAITFGLDWELQATMVPVDGRVCDGSWTFDVAGDGTAVEALGVAGHYRVDTFARGEQGDAAWAFGLETTRDRTEPAPFVQAYWYPAGEELDPTTSFSGQVGNLAEVPDAVSASATVTSSTGQSKTFELAGELFEDCFASAAGLTGPAGMTAEILTLGPPPYDVALTIKLDGADFGDAVITWPDDFPTNSNESARIPLTNP